MLSSSGAAPRVDPVPRLAAPAAPPPDVSVVIPVFDAVRDLPQQLDALAAQEFAGRFEVVLADNGSTDGLREAVAGWAPLLPFPLRVVDASDVRGVSHARNVGCRAATAPLLAICDADDVVSPQWLARLVEALGSADVVGGALTSERLNPDHVRSWRPMYPPGRLPRKLRYLPYAQGANIGLRRDVFERLGGWDERFVGGGDDVEFSWRAQHSGFRLAAAPHALVYYRLRPSLRAMMRQTYAYARSDAHLLTEFDGSGVRPTPAHRLVLEVGWIVVTSPLVVSPAWRGFWLRRVALLAGRVAGSVHYRRWAV